MHEKLPSRRDWFRLKKQSASPADSPEKAANQLRRLPDANFECIPLPPNPAGLDDGAFPPMCEAMLNAEKVADLANDIFESGEEVSLLARSVTASSPGDSKSLTRWQLQASFSALISGGVNRIQVRYRWNGANWIDTLERRGNEFRLVRVCHERQGKPG